MPPRHWIIAGCEVKKVSQMQYNPTRFTLRITCNPKNFSGSTPDLYVDPLTSYCLKSAESLHTLLKFGRGIEINVITKCSKANHLGLLCRNQMAAREYKQYDTVCYDSFLGSTSSNRLLKTSSQIELLEHKIATQASEKETLLIRNQRLNATNATMRKDLAANMKEVKGIKIQIGSINIESDIQVRSLMKKIMEIEDDVHEEDSLKEELQQAYAKVGHLINKKMELNDEIEILIEKIKNGNRTVRSLPRLIVERNGLKEEYKNICTTFEHDKKCNTEDVEHLYVMEKKLIAMASESEKLQADICNATKGGTAMQPNEF